MTDLLHSSKIKAWHLERFAIVYIRQSDPQQPIKHPESTARQYALVDRAVALGWPRERVIVIDDDQGKTGSTAEGRLGFHYLLAEVALDHVGLILGLEVSRPARCCKDWYQLLELCSRFHALLADSDGVYDPTNYNDRLLLGLKGMMSEAELHILKERMYGAKLNKARRGELYHLPPIGYIKLPTKEFALDPDEQVQATVRLIFDQFDRQGTVHGLLRYLVRHRIQIPVRLHGGVNKGQLEWHRPNRSTLLNILHRPIYAGAYLYGQRAIDPRKKSPGRPRTGRQCLPLEQCAVFIHDHEPAYITWQRFEANQRRLADNQNKYDRPGAPRQGAALLGGLLYCGRCGQRMHVDYCGREKTPSYACNRNCVNYGDPLCQSLSGKNLDALAAAQILAAVEPAALEASMAAVADVERERAALMKNWTLRIERARYESARAHRQYHACEPENRLVARALEKCWEEALRQQRQLEEEFDRWKRSVPPRLSAQDQQAIRALAADLPALWQAETTTHQDRQRIARLLLERVTVVVDKKSERVDVKLHWIGGQVGEHTINRPVSRYDHLGDYPRLVERLRELCRQKLRSWEIAERLNAEGFRPPKRTGQFNAVMVARLAAARGLLRRKRNGTRDGLQPDEYHPAGLARQLGMSVDTITRWTRAGWLNVRRDEIGHRIIWADADELLRLKELLQLPRTRENKQRLAELTKPKQPPKR